MAKRDELTLSVYESWQSGKTQREVAAQFGWQSVTMVRVHLSRYDRMIRKRGGKPIMGYDGKFYRDGAPPLTPEQIKERDLIMDAVRRAMAEH